MPTSEDFENIHTSSEIVGSSSEVIYNAQSHVNLTHLTWNIVTVGWVFNFRVCMLLKGTGTLIIIIFICFLQNEFSSTINICTKVTACLLKK